MKSKIFDYYIFIDYSLDLIGYVIISKSNVYDCLLKTSKLKHYKNLKYKRAYLRSMKKLFEKNEILRSVDKYRVTELRYNIEICSEVFDFCKKHPDSKIFISIDDRQYKGFMKILRSIDGKRFTILKEGKLVKNSREYKLSLIIDTLLNLKRSKN